MKKGVPTSTRSWWQKEKEGDQQKKKNVVHTDPYCLDGTRVDLGFMTEIFFTGRIITCHIVYKLPNRRDALGDPHLIFIT